jgi:GTP-binding protein
LATWLPPSVKLSNVEFVTSAAGATDFPSDRIPEIAFVGRSNVGKSSLINALVRRPVARTSAAPGKTRLINLYRIVPAGGRPFYFADMPGYGYARGVTGDASFAPLVHEYFARLAPAADEKAGTHQRGAWIAGAILCVDARHPGLPIDLAAHAWLVQRGVTTALIAMKADKLSQAARSRMRRDLEKWFQVPALPVSATSGEGLDTLWKAIAGLISSQQAGQSSQPSNWHP